MGHKESDMTEWLNNNKNKRSSSEFNLLFHLRLLRIRQLVACPRLLYQWQHQSRILSPAPRLFFLTRPFPKYLPHLPSTILPYIHLTAFICSCPSLCVKLYMRRILLLHFMPTIQTSSNSSSIFPVCQTREVREEA